MKPIIKDGCILRDEHGNWTTHSIPLAFSFPVYHAVLGKISFDTVSTFDEIAARTIGPLGGIESSTDLVRCLADLEKVQCVRRVGGGWVAIRAKDCKIKGGPFPLDHIMHQPIPRY